MSVSDAGSLHFFPDRALSHRVSWYMAVLHARDCCCTLNYARLIDSRHAVRLLLDKSAACILEIVPLVLRFGDEYTRMC